MWRAEHDASATRTRVAKRGRRVGNVTAFAPVLSSNMATMDEVRKTLKERFKLDAFRSHQAAIIERLVVANASALAILPTGMGKSLTYQLPALLLPGLTLVISPLLALMKDQVDSLVCKGIAAGRIDSSQSKEEYQAVMDQLYAGDLRLLYVAPERYACLLSCLYACK
jgi:superfamily II DNA helicase RecQ